MKIEIELQELEQLRKETFHYKKQLEETEKQLKDLQEKTDAADLRKKAIELAHKLTHKYLSVILKGIGFKDTETNFSYGGNVLRFDRNFSEKKFGSDWWRNEEELIVTVGASVSDAFREAYVRIGIKPEPPKTEEEVQKDLLEI